MKVGNLTIYEGDAVYIYIEGIHHNSKEWQRPSEFLPQRFDREDPLFLTSDGKTRNPFSFIPFSGGRRICFGKTFAEANLNYLTAFISQFFDYEFVEADKYRDKYPKAFTFMSRVIPIPVIVRPRKQ